MSDLKQVLQKHSPVPLYIQFKEWLLNQIETGQWQDGQQIPSERQLGEAFDISRITVRQALKELMRDGLLESVPGKGNFVRRKPVAIFKPQVSFTVATQMQNQTPSSQLLAQQTVYAAHGLVRELEIPLNAPLLMIHRLRLVDGQPRVLQKAYVPLKVCPALSDYDFSKESLYQVLEETCELVPVRAKSSFEARLADKTEAEFLGLPRPAAVLVMRQTSYLANGRPIEFCRSIYRANERFTVE